jgi:hypothetical protein
MKSRMWLSAALAALMAAAVMTASPRALYRIRLRGGGEVLTNDRPFHRGSVVLFRLHSNGVLTSLPEEDVLGVVPNLIDVRAQGLQPGDVVFIGPTGAGALSTVPAAAAASMTLPGGVYDPRNPAYGYSARPYGSNQAGASAGVFSPTTPVTPGDLARAISAEPPTAENPVGSNGLVTVSGAAPPVGPDGQPVLAPPGSSGSTPVVIGPNGTPVLAPAGAPGSAPPPVGPNGVPVMAPAGAPGSASPSVGPNGAPVLAPPGAPGSSSPPVGSNGFPSPGGPGR